MRGGGGGDVVYKGIIAFADTRCGSNDFPGPTVSPLDWENLLAAKQKEL